MSVCVRVRLDEVAGEREKEREDEGMRKGEYGSSQMTPILYPIDQNNPFSFVTVTSFYSHTHTCSIVSQRRIVPSLRVG